MSKTLLIDALHPEEIRVVVLNRGRIEEFDRESASRKPIKGNIYLAKVTRVEPSLQAAFVEYGGNRHGFLAFSEIHPDYYRIPVEDREALIKAEEDAAAEAAEAFEAEAVSDHGDDEAPHAAETGSGDVASYAPDSPLPFETASDSDAPVEFGSSDAPSAAATQESAAHEDPYGPRESGDIHDTGEKEEPTPFYMSADADIPPADVGTSGAPAEPAPMDLETTAVDSPPDAVTSADGESADGGETTGTGDENAEHGDSQSSASMASSEGASPAVHGEARKPESDDIGEAVRRRRQLLRRRYKIQEVIKRRQILLIQVTKEERGTKGAALTTYLSLAGRYCVLMPNTGRGGGISRKITSQKDRRRLKEIVDELQVPEGMSLILRTAGQQRNKAEVKRDYEYLVRLWDEIREQTMQSTAPALIYEEANITKRAIRDLYGRETDEVVVQGEEGYKAARSVMKAMMPSHVKRVRLYDDPHMPLFHRYNVETQLEAIYTPTVQLRSGGSIVINPTEALVAIDVNSGRSTRERNIEETATKTNLEAAEEVARQLRLRDLAGLIVIDFIDMEDGRNIQAVERKLKDAVKDDRARIQIGRISQFGLMEMSRQRLRPSLVEATTERCAVCGGTGHVRSVETTALQVLRAIEDHALKGKSAAISVAVSTRVALYLLNHSRRAITDIEAAHGMTIEVTGDDRLANATFRIDVTRVRQPGEGPDPEERRRELEARAAARKAEEQEEDTAEDIIEDEDVSDSDSEEPSQDGGGEEHREDGGEGRDHRPEQRRERRRGRRRGRGRDRGDRNGDHGHHRHANSHEERHAESGATENIVSGEGQDDFVGSPAEVRNDHGPGEHGQDTAGQQGHGQGEGRRRRRRGRRGGRRRRGDPNGEHRQPGQGHEGHDHQENGAPSVQAGSEPAPSSWQAQTGDEETPSYLPSGGGGERRSSWAPEESRPDAVSAPQEQTREDSRPTEPSPEPYRPAEERLAEPVRAEPPAPAPEPPSAPAPEEPPKPTRRGWWNRLTQ